MKEETLDARGLICPLPVLKARKKLMGMAAGDILRVQVTDPASPADFRLFCDESGHSIVSINDAGEGVAEVTLRRGA